MKRRELELLSKSKGIHLLEHLEVTNKEDKEDSDIMLSNSLQKKKVEPEEKPKKPAKYIEYAPRIFYMIRTMDNISSDALQESFDIERNSKAIFKAGESQGKSGSFFFFTYDKRFLIKTMTKKEYKTMIKLLPKYYAHFKKNPDSVIARILGLYSLKLPEVDKIHFFLMENVIQTVDDNKLLGIFDLKGSKISREVIKAEILPSETQKDVNLQKILDSTIDPNHAVFLYVY